MRQKKGDLLSTGRGHPKNGNGRGKVFGAMAESRNRAYQRREKNS